VAAQQLPAVQERPLQQSLPELQAVEAAPHAQVEPTQEALQQSDGLVQGAAGGLQQLPCRQAAPAQQSFGEAQAVLGAEQPQLPASQLPLQQLEPTLQAPPVPSQHQPAGHSAPPQQSAADPQPASSAAQAQAPEELQLPLQQVVPVEQGAPGFAQQLDVRHEDWPQQSSLKRQVVGLVVEQPQNPAVQVRLQQSLFARQGAPSGTQQVCSANGPKTPLLIVPAAHKRPVQHSPSFRHWVPAP
jgi:hypothetical protein